MKSCCSRTVEAGSPSHLRTRPDFDNQRALARHRHHREHSYASICRRGTFIRSANRTSRSLYRRLYRQSICILIDMARHRIEVLCGTGLWRKAHYACHAYGYWMQWKPRIVICTLRSVEEDG